MLRRTLPSLALIVIIVPLLAACGPKAAAPTTATSAPTTAAATTAPMPTTVPTDAPKNTDALMSVSGAGSNVTVRNFNPFVGTSAMLGSSNCAYEPLMIVNGVTGEIVPWLATGYKFSDDVKTLTFTIREGVRWSDGQPFTANDVVFTFNLLRTKAGLQGPALQAMSAQGGFIDTVTAPDAKTAVFTLKWPYSLALYDLVQQNIVPEHIWKGIDDPSKFTNENPVGTGPFTEVKNFGSAQYELHRNPYYWQADKIAFGGFKVTIGLSADAQNLKIINGDFDWTGAPIVDIDKVYVAKDPANRGYWFPTPSTVLALELLTTKKPFDDPNVRKAISMAINRPQIIEIAMSGVSHPADVTGLADGFSVFKVADPSKLGDWTGYNPEKANQLLDAAGLKKGSDGVRVLADGTPMKYQLNIVNTFSNWVRAADIVAQNLKAVGISVSVKPMDFGALYDSTMKGNYDMTFFYAGGTTPYHFYRSVMSASTMAPVGQPAYLGNYVRFSSAKADELLNQWAATTDLAKQKEIAAQLQAEFAANAPLIPLYPQPYWLIYKTNNFTGFPTKDNPYALGSLDAGNTNALLVMTRIKPR